MDQQFQDLINKLKEAGINTKAFEQQFAKANGEVQRVNQLIEVMRGQLNEAKNSARGLSDEYTGIYGTLQAVTAEITKSNSATNRSQKAYRSLTSEVQKLANEEEGIYALSTKQLSSIRDKSKEKLKEIRLAASALVREKDLKGISDEYLKTRQDLTEEQKSILRAKRSGFEIEKDAIAAVEKRLIKEQAVTKAVGLTGGALSAAEKVLNTLGISGLSDQFTDLTTEIKDKQRKAIDEQIRLWEEEGKTIEEIEKSLENFAPSIGAAGMAAKGLGKILGKALMDPAAFGTAVLDSYLKLDKAATKFKNLTGQNVAIQSAHNTRMASGVDIMELMADYTAETGLNAAAVFNSGDLARLAEAKNLLGLSSKEASNLGLFAKASGNTIRESQEAIVASTNSYNGLNKGAVAHGVVMKDVLNVSEEIGYSLGGNTKKIAGAAAAARGLGLSLAKVEDIAGNLMNFESSIEAELEAQLLTGKSINMSKARELALNNDLEGLAKELANQGASAAEFASMNRIQQEAMAKALGMSRNELGKTIAAQAAQGELTDEQRAKMQGVTLEQLEQQDAATALKNAFAKISEPLASILTALTPILNVVAKVVSFLAPVAGYVLPLVMAFRAASQYGGILAKHSGSMVSAFKNMSFKGIKEKVTSVFGAVKDKFNLGKDTYGKVQSKAGDWYDKNSPQGKMIRTKGGTVPLDGDKAKDASKAMKGTSDAAKGADGVKQGLGAKIKEFFTGLAEGLKAMASGDVLRGGINALIASPGLIALGIASPGLYIISKINGEGVQNAIKGVAEGLKSFADSKVLQGALYLIPAALGFALMTAGAVGLGAVALLGAAAGGGLTALGTGLIGFANAMAASTPLGPVGLVAPVALALLGASMIPFAYALNIASPAITAFGSAIKMAFEGIGSIITSVAQGFALMINAIGSNIGAALLMGPALLGIAAGLSAIAIAGFLAIPAIGALAALSVVAAPIIALAGALGIENEDSSGDDKIGEKLDRLIAAVESGGNVYLDSNKVGNALVLGAYKSS